MNYLGERYDAESGRTVEVYGRKLKNGGVAGRFAPRRKGARGCEQTAEAVSEALLDGLCRWLTLDELSWEKTERNEEYGMFPAGAPRAARPTSWRRQTRRARC